MGKALKGVDVDDNAFVGIETIIQSMTLRFERAGTSASSTAAAGQPHRQRSLGEAVEEVNRLLKQFEDMKKVMGHDGSRVAVLPRVPRHAPAGPRPMTMSASRPSFDL